MTSLFAANTPHWLRWFKGVDLTLVRYWQPAVVYCDR